MKKYTPILLIISSLLLLGCFQGYWLYKAYQEQKDLLTKQTDNLFQTTMAAQEDSLVGQSLGKVFNFKGPQIAEITNKPNAKTKRLVKSSVKMVFKKDTIFPTIPNNASLEITGLNISSDNPNEAKNYRKLIGTLVKQIVVMTDKDSSQRRNKPRFMLLQANGDTIVAHRSSADSGQKRLALDRMMYYFSDSVPKRKDLKSFFFSVDAQKKPKKIPTARVQIVQQPTLTISVNPSNGVEKSSRKSFSIVNSKSKAKIEFLVNLKPDAMQKAYQKALSKAQILLPFKIKTNPNKAGLLPTDTLKTSVYKASFSVNSFQAVFEQDKVYLFQKILPQSLFSLFLLGLVGLSFGLIYRNLQQQRRLTELKNDFISNITHELKTPITTVGVAMEALSNFSVLNNPAQTKEYIDISKSELNRLSLLVDRVLKMAVFEQSDPELQLENVDLSEQINTVIKSMKLQFEKYNADVDFSMEGQHFDLQADRIHTTNVLYNLLDNALKYANGQPV